MTAGRRRVARRVSRCASQVAGPLCVAGRAFLYEFLYRRADIEDVVTAHLLAMQMAPTIDFGRYIISATTPFTRDGLRELRTDAPSLGTSRRFQGLPCAVRTKVTNPSTTAR